MNENRLREIIKEEIAPLVEFRDIFFDVPVVIAEVLIDVKNIVEILENSDVVYKGIVEIQENLAKKIKILDKFNVN